MWPAGVEGRVAAAKREPETLFCATQMEECFQTKQVIQYLCVDQLIVVEAAKHLLRICKVRLLRPALPNRLCDQCNAVDDHLLSATS